MEPIKFKWKRDKRKVYSCSCSFVYMEVWKADGNWKNVVRTKERSILEFGNCFKTATAARAAAESFVTNELRKLGGHDGAD